MDREAINALIIEMSPLWDAVMAGCLAVMMFAVALGLRPAQFAFFKTDPQHYLAGVTAQIIGLPLLTLGLVYALDPMPSLALGMILVACCPGGNISNIMSLFGRANTALSVSMTATSSLAAAFITPFAILFWLSLYAPTRDLLTQIDFNALRFLRQTLLILAVPIFIGMFVAWKWSKLAGTLQKPLAMISVGILIAITLLGFYKYRDLLPGIGPIVLPLVFVHNACALGLGYLTGRFTQADTPTRRALTFEIGIQNSGLGFVILLTQMAGLGGAAALTGMWGLWHIISGLAMVALFRAADKKHV